VCADYPDDFSFSHWLSLFAARFCFRPLVNILALIAMSSTKQTLLGESQRYQILSTICVLDSQ
jgi:hypothetical protein